MFFLDELYRFVCLEIAVYSLHSLLSIEDLYWIVVIFFSPFFLSRLFANLVSLSRIHDDDRAVGIETVLVNRCVNLCCDHICVHDCTYRAE